MYMTPHLIHVGSESFPSQRIAERRCAEPDGLCYVASSDKVAIMHIILIDGRTYQGMKSLLVAASAT